MIEGIEGIPVQLRHEKAVIDRALAALRGVEGIEAPAPGAAKQNAPAKEDCDGANREAGQDKHPYPGRPAESRRGEGSSAESASRAASAARLPLVLRTKNSRSL
jgi:hypothetical protein